MLSCFAAVRPNSAKCGEIRTGISEQVQKLDYNPDRRKSGKRIKGLTLTMKTFARGWGIFIVNSLNTCAIGRFYKYPKWILSLRNDLHEALIAGG